MHTVVSVAEGTGDAFASATVTFASGTSEAACDAVQVALLALRGALGVQRPPSALLASLSAELPRTAVAAAAEALTGALGPEVPLVGCSSHLRIPDERRAGWGGAGSGSGGGGGGDGGGSTASAAGAGAVEGPSLNDASAVRPRPYHVTLAGAHLPYHEVHALRSQTGSLPPLPHLGPALRGARPPAFLLLAGADGPGAELMGRLENLFPGSCVGAGLAAPRERRPAQAAAGGGSGSGGAGPASDAGAGPSGRPAQPGPGAARGIGGVTTGGPASELEGPFQRMLLDRDGADPGGAASSGRRRRPPPLPAAAAAASSLDESPTDSDSERAASDGTAESDAAAAAAAEAAGPPPPFLITGREVYGGAGCAVLAIYPRTEAEPHPPPPSPPAAATEANASGAAPAAIGGGGGATGGGGTGSGWRLSAPSADWLARVALGSDALRHVVLRSSALSAISPPPTGPEPAPAWPPAPADPLSWRPAAPLPPALVVDPPPYPGPSQAQAQDREGPWLAQAQALDRGLGGDAPGPWEGPGGGAGGAPPPAGLEGLPLFPLESAVLFPGQTMQLRVFEKRYRLLVASCLEQGAAFGLCWRGVGTTAVVRSYQSGPSHEAGYVAVLLQGGCRFSYEPSDLTVLPASYGLNAAVSAPYLHDEPPRSPEEVRALLAAARSVMSALAGAAAELGAQVPPAQQPARAFANALHLMGSAQPPPQPSTAASQRSTAAAAAPAAASSAAPQPSLTAQLLKAAAAAEVAAAAAALDPAGASALSLALAPHIPLQIEAMRREWLTGRSALPRLQQQAAWLHGSPRVAAATAASVLALPRGHPLRSALGLSSWGLGA
ncbi:hypothetical protein HYH03_006368 [Edaphochlamys debaryana]|uniref:Lon N-terminal domain-containing protein n=1 Tax=Edaphochlamys debaryana TaxID=47281 RepID=A0A835Y3S2_9CHLO|nr:hypothetical protein HYH03_006368 [Edaphochlamys debaryana]|eukprot:KAG2495421.1 hypothetical protein HYH03_006368 [Edaphochlamys debaryana]